jgi:YegS/Rv2252/BmrU family lipid kinase
METERTLIILNPYAGGGRAGRLWSEVEPLLWEELGELVVAVTQHPEDVAEHLDKARDAGLTRVIAIGGDGTNHAIINAIQTLTIADSSAPKMTFGQLPIGTGQDFSRTLGIPSNPREAVKWIAHAQPKAIDLGYLDYDDQNRHFLNIASAGISGEVDRRVNAVKKRRPWTFKLSTIKSILTYHPQRMKVWLDDDIWYDDKAWTLVVANGRIFGHGMAIAPNAEIDDGLFDVILIENTSRLTAIMALNTVYSGKHLLRSDVHHRQAKVVKVESLDNQLGLDLDGEYATGEQLRFSVKSGALQMLVGG